MKSTKLWVAWVLVGMGLPMLLSVGFFGSEESVSTEDSTDPVFVGGGNIASRNSQGDEATANLSKSQALFTPPEITPMSQAPPLSSQTATLPAGSLLDQGQNVFRGGNHEYQTEGATGYFDYFGARAGDPTKGYYSYNLDEWMWSP